MLHVLTRVVELVAGSVAGALFPLGEPWNAADDRRQERALAALICSGTGSVGAFIRYYMAKAAALIRRTLLRGAIEPHRSRQLSIGGARNIAMVSERKIRPLGLSGVGADQISRLAPVVAGIAAASSRKRHFAPIPRRD